MIYAPLVLVSVLVSARSSAQLIPNVSEPNPAADQRPPVDASQKLRGHAHETEKRDEERVGPSPHLDPQWLSSILRNGESSADPLAPSLKSSIPSLTQDKIVAEPLSSNVPNKDLSHLKKNNEELIRRMELLGINLDEVVNVVQTLHTRGVFSINKFSEYSLTLMALGSVYFKIFESSSNEINTMHFNMLKTVFGKYVDSPEFKGWIASHSGSHVSIRKVYGKIRWLVEFGGLKKCDKQDLADMAFGSEFFIVNEIDLSLLLPRSETLFKPKHRILHLINLDDVDPKVKHKLRAFAEDPDSFDYSVEELLRRAKDAVLEDELTHLKSNEAFTQRMETLGINIDDAKADVRVLRTIVKGEISQYNDYSLTSMILGSRFFNNIKVPSFKIMPVTRSRLGYNKNRYVKSKEFKDWTDDRKRSGVAMKNVNGKMLWLVDEAGLKIKDEELAEMAYGSEYFRQKNIDLDSIWSNYLNKLLKERGGNSKEVRDKRETKITQDSNSFIGNNAELLEGKEKDALLGAEMDENPHQKKKSRLN